MEKELVSDDKIDIARRVYHALRAQYPDRFITLCDPQGRVVLTHIGRPVMPKFTAVDDPADTRALPNKAN
jgi:hypothetical protein